jgi:hypothetical protein
MSDQDDKKKTLRDLVNQVPFDEERWYEEARKTNWRAVDKQIGAEAHFVEPGEVPGED